jgi:adenylate cyclase
MFNRSIVWIRAAIFLSILAVLISLHIGYGSYFFKPLENKIWNFYQQQGERYTSYTPKSVIVTIDDNSLKELGDWPWPRQRILDLVRILLEDYNVSIIGFDIFFPDKKEQDSAADQALLQLAQQHKLVFAQTFSLNDKQHYIERKTGVLGGTLTEIDSSIRQQFPSAMGYIANDDVLAQAPCLGHIVPKKDREGVISHVPAFIQWQDNLYPSFALEMLRCLMFTDYHLEKSEHASAQHRVFQIFSNLGGKDQLLLNNQGYWRIPYTVALDDLIDIPVLDIFNHKVPKELLDNQMIVIGSGISGLGDLHTTPQGINIKGVTVHIQLIEWLLSSAPILPASQLEIVTWLWLIISLSFLYWMLFRGVSVFYLLLSNIVLAVSWLALGYYLWISWQWWLPILPLLAYTLFAVLQIPTEWAVTQQRAKQLRQLFQGYLPVPVVDSLIHSNNTAIIEPKRCELTILFADIADFTQRAEACEPEKIAMLTQQILESLTQVVYECEGTLDKYMGDAVMAFWNAPIKQDNHADLAVKAGIKMIDAINLFNQGYADNKKFEPITIRIGIHTGVVVVGNLGTKYRHAYTALGDAVNVSARLQEKAKDLQEYILISETTVAAFKQSCNLLKKESVSLRGRKKEVGIYTLSAHNHQPK